MSPDVDALRAALARLSPAQALAVSALAGGSSHVDAAQVAGVTRETVGRWVAHHPAVRAALAEAQVAMASEHMIAAAQIRSSALHLAGLALDALAERLSTDDVDPVAVLRAVAPFAAAPAALPVTLDASTLLDAQVREMGKRALSPADHLLQTVPGAVRRLAEVVDVDA